MTTHLPVATPLGRPIRLGVLISGSGTTLVNFQKRIAEGSLNAEVAQVIANRSDCTGSDRAREFGLPTTTIARGAFTSVEEFSGALFDSLRDAEVDLVALAGFLSLIKIPEDFRHRVMNIHPSLIPAFCGRGFFGHKVHEAVLDRGAKITGCTVHFADNEYDHGPIILQRGVAVKDDDTPDTLAKSVFVAECAAYPEAIGLFASGRLAIVGRRVRVSTEGHKK